jgi:hypothetical protein
MGIKKIKFGLSSSEIDRAIKELNSYKQEVIKKTALLRERIAVEIAENAQSAFSRAIVDDLLNGSQRMAEVQVSVNNGDNVSVIIARGNDAVFIEFRAGVFNNGSVGSSPHPKGQELGFTIGGYGKGLGKRQVWGFYDGGELLLTHGTPAVMPMYNSIRTVCDNIYTIIREIWK